MTHGRHCPCTGCANEDWTQDDLAPCGMHGPSCPNVYAPRLSAGKETEDIAFERSLLRADIKAGNADAAAEQLRRVRTLEGDNDGASV